MTTVAVITGAASGMGLACARRLAGGCDAMVLADLAPVDLAALGIAGQAEVARTNVSDRRAVESLAERAASRGDVRWLVHAAGVSPTMGDARRMFEVNLVGTALVVAAFQPVMADGGAAVLFASVAAHFVGTTSDETLDAVFADPLADGAAERFIGSPLVNGDPGAAYGFAKRGVMRLVQRRAPEWAARGAWINSVTPGSIDTPMGKAELAGQPMMREMVAHTPAGRLGTADEVAAAVGFLLSDDAGYVTGTDLLVDGGVVAAMLGG